MGVCCLAGFDGMRERMCMSEIEQNLCQLGLSHNVCVCVSEIEQNVCQLGLSHRVCVRVRD